MKLKINISQIFDYAQDELGMIGKRIKTQDGEPTYSSVQLSSREKPVVARLVQEAVQAAFSVIPERLSDYHKEDEDILFSANGGRDSDELTEFFNDVFMNYVLAYVLAQYLSMTAPELAKKYITQADSLLINLRSAMLNKSAFFSSADSLEETSGSVSYN